MHKYTMTKWQRLYVPIYPWNWRSDLRLITWGDEDSSDYAQQKVLISEIVVEMIIWFYASMILCAYDSTTLWFCPYMILCFYDSMFLWFIFYDAMLQNTTVSIKQDNMVLTQICSVGVHNVEKNENISNRYRNFIISTFRRCGHSSCLSYNKLCVW